jgi:heavy metal sensor kinase
MDMLHKLRPRHVRTRLTLWYVFGLAGVLIVSWSLTAAFMFYEMRNQLDHYAVQDIETVEGLLYFDASGRLLQHEDYHNHPESKQVLERFLEVRSSEGAVLYRNERLGNQALGGSAFPSEGQGQYSNRSARLADGTPVRMVSRRHVLDGHPLLLRLGYSERPSWMRFEEFGTASLLALPIVLAASGLAGYILTRRALAPLQEMAYKVQRITSENLHERLPVGAAGDELDHLARVFNSLLARLEQSFEQLRRFTADASHELRTPLASIRSVGEVALRKNGDREAYRDTVGSMLEEVNRLTALVDSLLTISRADAGRIQLHPTVFSVMALAREAAGLFDVLVEEKDLQIAIEGDEDASLTGDRVFLRQALVNIIHNAVKYSLPGGSISVRVHHKPAGSVEVEVADAGPGISPEHFEKIFDRFYRVDESRSREAGGAGLGLSIAQWVVRIHGGDIRLVPTPGGGCTFQIRLPALTPPAGQS